MDLCRQAEPREQFFAVPLVLPGQPDDVLVRGVGVGVMLHRGFVFPNTQRGLLDERQFAHADGKFEVGGLEQFVCGATDFPPKLHEARGLDAPTRQDDNLAGIVSPRGLQKRVAARPFPVRHDVFQVEHFGGLTPLAVGLEIGVGCEEVLGAGLVFPDHQPRIHPKTGHQVESLAAAGAHRFEKGQSGDALQPA